MTAPMSDNPPAGGDLTALAERCEAEMVVAAEMALGERGSVFLHKTAAMRHAANCALVSAALRARATLKSEEKL